MNPNSTHIPGLSQEQVNAFAWTNLTVKLWIDKVLSQLTLPPEKAQSLVWLAAWKMISAEEEDSLRDALHDTDIGSAQVLFLARRILSAILHVSKDISGAEFQQKAGDCSDANMPIQTVLWGTWFRLFQTMARDVDEDALTDEPTTSGWGTLKSLIEAIRMANKTATEREHARIGNQLRLAAQNPYLLVKMLLQDDKRHIFTYDFEGQSYFGISSRAGMKNSISYLSGNTFMPTSHALWADTKYSPPDHAEWDIYFLGYWEDTKEIILRVRGDDMTIVSPWIQPLDCTYFQANDVLHFHRFSGTSKEQVLKGGITVFHGPTARMDISHGDRYFRNDGWYKIVRSADGKVFSVWAQTIADLYPEGQLPESGVIFTPDRRPPWQSWPPHNWFIADLTK